MAYGSSCWFLLDYKKIFKLRSLGQAMISYDIGNGQDTFLWLDNWHPLGPLYQKFGDRVVHNLGRSLSAKVTSIIHNGSWKLPTLRNRDIQQIMVNNLATLHPKVHCPDKVVWIHTSREYSSKSAWNVIRPVRNNVSWYIIVWFNQNYPSRLLLSGSAV